MKTNYNSKIRQEFLDYDYLDKLTQEEYDWLAAFTHEDNCANFSHNGDKVLSRSKKSKKKIYDKNNARNRDAFGITHAQKRLMYTEAGGLEFLEDYDISERNPEDSMIELIDAKNREFTVDEIKRQIKQADRVIKKRKLERK